MQISSTSPYQLTGATATASVNPTKSEKTTEIATAPETTKEERNYGAFYDSWTDEAKEAYNAMVDQAESFEDKAIATFRLITMERTYAMRLASKGKELGPDTVDGIMAEADRIRESKDYPPLSTKEGFNAMMKEVIGAVDIPGGNQDTIDFYKTLFSMANSGYQPLDFNV